MLAEPVQHALATRNCIEPFLPCDITVYDVTHPHLQADFVWECILAVVQEPLPTSIITRQIAAASSDAPATAAETRDRRFHGTICKNACQEMDGESYA